MRRTLNFFGVFYFRFLLTVPIIFVDQTVFVFCRFGYVFQLGESWLKIAGGHFGSRFRLCCDTFSICWLVLDCIYWAFIWPYLFYFTMVQSLFSLWKPFVFSLGLIASAICCVGDFQRSSSRRPLLRRFYRHHGDDEEAPPRSPLPRRRTEADTRSQRSPLPRRLQFIGFYKSSFDSL